MDILTIIKEQRKELEWIELNERIIKRKDLDKASNFLKHPNILAVLGIRRCGKSIFSYSLAKNEAVGYINFDDERLAGVKTEDLNKILESFYELYGNLNFIILDEIQNLEGWELFANRLRRSKKVILTGSNSKLLSGELSTHLTGRYIDFVLFPFSFKEFLDFKDFKLSKVYTTEEKASIMNLLKEYLDTGGFPEAYKLGKVIVTKIYDDIVTKDIILRHKIRNINGLKNLAKYLITNSCEEVSYTRLLKFIEIKEVSTISKWISYLEQAFLIIKLDKFSFKLKQQFISPKKVYCMDTGIISGVGFRFSEDMGKFMENSVLIELHRRRNYGDEIYYWKDYTHNEVDFLIKKNEKIISLIQVTYADNELDIKEREAKSLIKASKELKCSNLIIITWDFEAEREIEGKKIKFIPLWRWLLD